MWLKELSRYHLYTRSSRTSEVLGYPEERSSDSNDLLAHGMEKKLLEAQESERP